MSYRPGSYKFLGLGQGYQCSGVSPAVGQKKRPVKSKKKLMNIEHRTSNVQHRIMYSVNLK
jgi:hypothetical protein